MSGQKFEGRSAEMKTNSPWLASEDIDGLGDVVVEIDCVMSHKGVTFEDNRKEDVFTLRFKGKSKEMVLNNTNRKTLVAMYGPETLEWTGKQIALYVVHLKAFGKPTTGLRIKPVDERQKMTEAERVARTLAITLHDKVGCQTPADAAAVLSFMLEKPTTMEDVKKDIDEMKSFLNAFNDSIAEGGDPENLLQTALECVVTKEENE